VDLLFNGLLDRVPFISLSEHVLQTCQVSVDRRRFTPWLDEIGLKTLHDPATKTPQFHVTESVPEPESGFFWINNGLFSRLIAFLPLGPLDIFVCELLERVAPNFSDFLIWTVSDFLPPLGKQVLGSMMLTGPGALPHDLTVKACVPDTINGPSFVYAFLHLLILLSPLDSPRAIFQSPPFWALVVYPVSSSIFHSHLLSIWLLCPSRNLNHQ
jgi:hypothetical protein